MAELADAADSKSADLRVLGVRLPLPAPAVWWNDGGHRETDRCPDSTTLSAFVPPCPMKPIVKIRKSRSVLRLEPPSCALPPKNVLLPAKIYSNRHHLPLPSSSPSHTALLPPSTPVHPPSHATHRRYRKPIATAPDRTAGRLPSSRCIRSDRHRPEPATNFSSAVASDTTLGLQGIYPCSVEKIGACVP
jgi:hypothetical protein